MKLAWCPETAFKAYIDAVRSLSAHPDLEEAHIAELIAAMAGGFKSQLILDACNNSPSTTLAISAALKHTHGQHMTILPEKSTQQEYSAEGVDFVVVDMRRRDADRVVKEARVGPRGMVVVCKNVEKGDSGVNLVTGKGTRVVRSAYLPIGVEILHVGVGKGPRIGRRWFKHVDRVTGEEHLFRK